MSTPIFHRFLYRFFLVQSIAEYCSEKKFKKILQHILKKFYTIFYKNSVDYFRISIEMSLQDSYKTPIKILQKKSIFFWPRVTINTETHKDGRKPNSQSGQSLCSLQDVRKGNLPARDSPTPSLWVKITAARAEYCQSSLPSWTTSHLLFLISSNIFQHSDHNGVYLRRGGDTGGIKRVLYIPQWTRTVIPLSAPRRSAQGKMLA